MFDWTQNPQTVTISIPLSYKIGAKKIESTITENYVKLNIPEMKMFKFIDLYSTIDTECSNVVVEDRRIIFYLQKVKEENWETVDFKTNNKEELKERRKVAEENWNKKVQEERELAKNKKAELNKFVFDKSLKIDEDKRKELRELKSNEKNQAEQELYKFINDIDGTQKAAEENKIKEFKKEEISLKAYKRETQESNYKQESNEDLVNTIKTSNLSQLEENSKKMTEKIEEKPKEAPSMRPQSKINVNLTEKMIPHFAARESLSKEPPYPKSKKYVPEKNMLGQEIEDRNPLWIKEKADNFFKNKDYRSAINAYNRAIDLDPDFHKCYLNRATCLILLGEFELALIDLQKLDDLIERVDQKEKEDSFFIKIKVKALIKSYAVHSILNNYSKALEILDSLLTSREHTLLLGEKTMEKIQRDKELIEHRKIIEETKVTADRLVQEKEFDMAKALYQNILQANTHPNEKILSNLSLIALNEKHFEGAIRYCNDVLKIIKNFKEKIQIKNKKFDNSLEIKILLRRAESYVEIGEMQKAQEDLESAERMEIRNQDILNKFNQFKEKLKTIVLENYQKSANELLKQKKFSEALEYYDKSISLIKKKDKLEQIKFFLNRSSCLLALGQFENVTLECTRIYGVILKQKNIATIKSNYEILKQISELEFNVLVKRAFAYTKNNKVEQAIKDYTSALVINPNDSNIKKNLISLKNINI